jgi:hypothetical protein
VSQPATVQRSDKRATPEERRCRFCGKLQVSRRARFAHEVNVHHVPPYHLRAAERTLLLAIIDLTNLTIAMGAGKETTAQGPHTKKIAEHLGVKRRYLRERLTALRARGFIYFDPNGGHLLTDLGRLALAQS